MGAPVPENADLEGLYRVRFPAEELASKHAIWRVLCDHFFQQFVNRDGTVVDIGAGYCEFINNIKARRRIAVDLNPSVRNFAEGGVEVINNSCMAMGELADGCADVVFMSNFLEHLPSKDLVLATLRESKRILKDNGRLVILQPNIRFLYDVYWDFFDHHTPLSDRSLNEAMALIGMTTEVLIPKFLPYTTKSRIPQSPWLVRLYLKVPLAWHVLGRQALLIARK
jgi:SAM-dependent methyltransferase